MLTVMGYDAGFTLPGIAIVTFPDQTFRLSEAVVTDFQTIHTERAVKTTVAGDDVRRIVLVVDLLKAVIEKHKPDVIVAELPLSGARSALAIKGMGFSTAMAVSTFRLLKQNVLYINPYENKRASTGNSHAEKDEVIRAVSKIWPEIDWPKMKSKRNKDKPDPAKQEAIADALSCVIALCASKELKSRAFASTPVL